jgi:hypothetical protein
MASLLDGSSIAGFHSAAVGQASAAHEDPMKMGVESRFSVQKT